MKAPSSFHRENKFKKTKKEISLDPSTNMAISVIFHSLATSFFHKARQRVPSFYFVNTYYISSPCKQWNLIAVAKTYIRGYVCFQNSF